MAIKAREGLLWRSVVEHVFRMCTALSQSPAPKIKARETGKLLFDMGQVTCLLNLNLFI
jgi:hypothetical protein